MVKHTKRTARRTARRTANRRTTKRTARRTAKHRGGNLTLTLKKKEDNIETMKMLFAELAQNVEKNENALETVIKLYDFLLENPDQFLANDKFRAILQTKIKEIDESQSGYIKTNDNTTEEYKKSREELKVLTNTYNRIYSDKELFQL